MAAFVSQDLTANGLALLAKALTGTTLHFTKIQMGKGYLGTGQSIRDLNALVEPVATLEITKLRKLDGGRAVVGGDFNNSGITEGFFYRELGLFAQDPDIGEILYCYGNSDNLAEWIPPVGTPTIIEKTIDIVTIIENAANVTASIKSQLYAPLDEFEELRDNTYKKDEVDNALGLKADKESTYTKSETDSLLSSKADKGITPEQIPMTVYNGYSSDTGGWVYKSELNIAVCTLYISNATGVALETGKLLSVGVFPEGYAPLSTIAVGSAWAHYNGVQRNVICTINFTTDGEIQIYVPSGTSVARAGATFAYFAE